ncbi:transposase [Oxynema sp. CENA135]|uniref:transposase n=1 Tax=Oxynema sp. CENA135 TaxID=984206 RepID=UPI001F3B687B|nr:transposase [Oxynema sp. CENA135]
MALSAREWTCSKCGTVHDLDLNAAQNLLAVGHTVTACGTSRGGSRTTPTAKNSSGAKTGTQIVRFGNQRPSFGGEDVNPARLP